MVTSDDIVGDVDVGARDALVREGARGVFVHPSPTRVGGLGVGVAMAATVMAPARHRDHQRHRASSSPMFASMTTTTTTTTTTFEDAREGDMDDVVRTRGIGTRRGGGGGLARAARRTSADVGCRLGGDSVRAIVVRTEACATSGASGSLNV